MEGGPYKDTQMNENDGPHGSGQTGSQEGRRQLDQETAETKDGGNWMRDEKTDNQLTH